MFVNCRFLFCRKKERRMLPSFVNSRDSQLCGAAVNDVVVTWSPPLVDFLKINTDAAFDVRSGVPKLGVDVCDNSCRGFVFVH